MVVSFIIIGRNEEKNLRRCIDSIQRSVTLSNILNYEIIYVDGDSSDRSIDVVSRFHQVKIFRVTGGRNAAVGRNIGAKESSGDILCFLDGDMELYPEFVIGIWNAEKQDVNGDFFAGRLIDVVGAERIDRPFSRTFPGGTFFIRRKIWESVNGMRTKFKTGEESDLALRLLKKGYKFQRRNELMVNHYTAPYEHDSRAWKRILDKSLFFSRAVLYRNHLFNRQMYALMLRIDKTFLLLVATIVATILYPLAGAALLGLYLIAVMLRIMKKGTLYMPFVKMILYYFLSDSLNLVYFFTFYPKTIKEEYVAVKKPVLREVE
jgi:glycosyltransferase involved in cell wall biosynthesis